MAHDYIIAIGGTGSRCLEAVVYLAAAGLFRRPIQVVMIDPDRTNGNSVKTLQVLANYHALHLAPQPALPQLRRALGLVRTNLPAPSLFQAAINRAEDGRDAQQAIFWENPNPGDRRFEQVIQYHAQADPLKKFLSLFYEPSDLGLVLDVGYRGRTNVGAVALKQDLESSVRTNQAGLREFIGKLNTDLSNHEARVFVMGSVFGGTGAAGIPTLPTLIDGLPPESISLDNRARLRYGCAMMTPYFSFPKSRNGVHGPATDSDKHVVATQAALLHYAHVPPGYQHVYCIGAPAKPQTNGMNAVGGQNQSNTAHYAEVVAALAALDFFSRASVDRNAKELHFADTLQQNKDLGVSWETLPVHPDNAILRQEVKCRLVALTTFAYFYKNILHRAFVNEHAYKETNWYRHNFKHLTLDDQGHLLGRLYDFSNSYLQWLSEIGENGRRADQQLPLFNWSAFQAEDRALCAQFLGNLMDGSGIHVRHGNAGYDQILAKWDEIILSNPGTVSATGLFIYLLHYAVMEFCRRNYSWSAWGTR